MSKSIKAITGMLKVRISSMNEGLTETQKTVIVQNKQGELNDIIEKIEAYQKVVETIRAKLEKVEEDGEMEMIKQEVLKFEDRMKEDSKLKSVKRKMVEHYKEKKEKWEITIDIMMIIGKYFEENIDFINAMKA